MNGVVAVVGDLCSLLAGDCAKTPSVNANTKITAANTNLILVNMRLVLSGSIRMRSQKKFSFGLSRISADQNWNNMVKARGLVRADFSVWIRILIRVYRPKSVAKFFRMFSSFTFIATRASRTAVT